MLLHHLSVLRHLHLAPDEHQHEQDQCRGLLELGAEHEARVLLDDAEAEPGDDDARNVAEAGGGDDDEGADRMDGAGERLDHPDHRDQHPGGAADGGIQRSEEHTSELKSLMRISYAVFCLKNTKTKTK